MALLIPNSMSIHPPSWGPIIIRTVHVACLHACRHAATMATIRIKFFRSLSTTTTSEVGAFSTSIRSIRPSSLHRDSALGLQWVLAPLKMCLVIVCDKVSGSKETRRGEQGSAEDGWTRTRQRNDRNNDTSNTAVRSTRQGCQQSDTADVAGVLINKIQEFLKDFLAERSLWLLYLCPVIFWKKCDFEIPCIVTFIE